MISFRNWWTIAFAWIVLAPQLASAQRREGEEIFLAKLRGEEVAAVTLPEMKAKERPKSLDKEVRVGLYLPTHLGPDPQVYSLMLGEDRFKSLLEQNKVECCNLHLQESRVRIYPSADSFATHITVGLSEPLAKRVAEIVRSLFPQTTVRRDPYAAGERPEDPPLAADSPPCAREGNPALGAEELRIYVEMTTRLFDRQQSVQVLEKLVVHVKLTISDTEGRIVHVFDVDGAAEVDGFTFAPVGPWEDVGQEALLQASDRLVESFQSSQSLTNCLKKLAEPRSLPAGLVLTAKLDDAASLLPNGRLDAGEEANLAVHIENHGPGPAFRVAVQAGSDQPEIHASGDGAIGDLALGDKRDVVLRVTGGLGLSTGLAKLRVEAVEKRGYGSRPVEVELATSQVLPPKLEIVDITLNDRGGRAVGDGDGQPGNGESIEAVVRVRNAGPGDGAGVAVTMVSPKVGAEILDPSVVLPRIPAGRVEEARLLFRLPFALEAQDLPLSFQAVDGRGAQVGSAIKDQTWKIYTKRPGIVLGVVFHDGKSAGSIGNDDGNASNGERIEAVITPVNRGALTARGVRITVEPDDVKLIPKPAILEIGDLPPQVDGAAQRFVFDIPREYGIDRPEGELRFTLTVTQQDFPPRREPATLSFRPLRPDLTLETTTPSLTRGMRDELFLRLRNAGGLRAEGVVVEVSTEATGVDLLDERGVPVRSRELTVGVLDPQASAPQSSIPINVRRNAALGSAPLRITVKQKDFSPLVRDVALNIAEERAEVVPVEPTDEPVPAAEPIAPMAPATISFLSHTEGQHLLREAVDLRFEVQAPTELAEVRLEGNGRRIPLDGTDSQNTTSGLRGATYQLRVPLEDGKNRFEVIVVTHQGARSARSLTLFRDHEVGRVWVVAIGISKYQDPTITGLRYADADARAVYEYFRLKLPESQVFLRVNEEATLREIKSLLGTQLVAQAFDPKDTVILYFAGHGMRDRVTPNLDPYFLPYDARSNDLYSSAFEMNEVTGLLRRLIPDRVVVLIDSCFSGAAGGRSPYDPKAEGDRALFSDEFLDLMAHAGQGRAVLTASGPDEAAQEDPDLGHGVFTYHLLEGLKGAADTIPAGEITPDGNITIFEIYKYISSKVNKATGGRQTPMLKAPDVAGEIILTEEGSSRDQH
jgi:uncharacterized caspase-like protein